MAILIGQPACIITPSAMAHRPMVEPSEISMPPLMITSVNGRATMPMQIKSLVLNSSILRSSMRGFRAQQRKFPVELHLRHLFVFTFGKGGHVFAPFITGHKAAVFQLPLMAGQRLA